LQTAYKRVCKHTTHPDHPPPAPEDDGLIYNIEKERAASNTNCDMTDDEAPSKP
jgi:hypothetical protein